jgi:hypothetical protein
MRRALALPALLAVRRLPAQVGEPLLAFLKARPWCLYAGPQSWRTSKYREFTWAG